MKIAEKLTSLKNEDQRRVLSLIAIYEDSIKNEESVDSKIREEEALLRQETANVRYFVEKLKGNGKDLDNWGQIQESAQNALNSYLRLLALEYIKEAVAF